MTDDDMTDDDMTDDDMTDDDMTADGTADSGGVRMVVDDTRCIGAGQCEMLAPDHFRVDDDSALAEFVGQDSLPITEAEMLIDRCPSGALSIAPSE